MAGLASASSLFAAEGSLSLPAEWNFSKGVKSQDVAEVKWEKVQLPHTWNAEDASNGGGKDMQSRDGYYRGPAAYQASFKSAKSAIEGKRVFLKFEAVATVATSYLNGEKLGEHKGGFAAHTYEISKQLKADGENDLLVLANNEWREDVIPLSGDFPVFGGIYRPVHLIVKNEVCISPLIYGSDGVQIIQQNVSKENAELKVNVWVDNSLSKSAATELQFILRDAEGKQVAESKLDAEIPAGESKQVSSLVKLAKPHLWHGIDDPYLYQLEVKLSSAGKPLDQFEHAVGFRFYHIDAEKGFFLNGEPYRLFGVNRHQDFGGKGWAISEAEQDLDMELIREIGARSLRLAHYPHSRYFYDLCDREGLMVWAELPLVDCISDHPDFAENSKNQLREMILQNGNNSSIFTWSMFNEMYHRKSPPANDVLVALNKLSHELDPSRFTVGASNKNNKELNNCTDHLAMNKYPGWYGGGATGMPGSMKKHNESGNKRGIAISEYGAGASIHHHELELKRPKTKGNWHPEGWQAHVHEENYRSIAAAGYCWGSFVWNMFDFASVWRTEGDKDGINDKGLVTYDRKVRKDAFYFYKANWSPEPVLHITAKRFVERDADKTPVKVYSNCGEVTLLVNGEEVGKAKPDEVMITSWKDVELKKGKNTIEVRATRDGKQVTDTCEWIVK